MGSRNRYRVMDRNRYRVAGRSCYKTASRNCYRAANMNRYRVGTGHPKAPNTFLGILFWCSASINAALHSGSK